MKKILKQLGLEADATPEQIAEKAIALLNAVKAAEKQIVTNSEANTDLMKINGNLAAELEALRGAQSASVGPKESTEFIKLVAEKRAAGLPRETAEEAARNQLAHDAAEAAAKKEKS